MSAGVRYLSDSGAGFDAEPMLALVAAWQGIACAGCGQRPGDFAPHEAVFAARSVRRRWGSLLHRREESLRQLHPELGSWSAIDPAERVSVLLAATNTRLGDLMGEDTPESGRVALDPFGSPMPQRPAAAVLESLSEHVGRLIATIDGATSEDWYRMRPEIDSTVAEVVWLALHAATHHAEDAELVLDGRFGERPSAWAGPDGHPGQFQSRRGPLR